MEYNGYKVCSEHPQFDIEWCKDVFKEIWIDHEYSRHGVFVEEGDIVIDCGANIGLFTNYALKQRKAKHVYSFECDELYFETLNQNVNENVTTIKAFVSDRDEAGHYNVDKMLSEFNLFYIDFMKVDIEWWEYPLLINMPDNTMKKINKWVIELHDIYNNSEKILEIIEKFTINGFDIKYEQVHKNTNLALLYTKKRL
jgi:hypothetical protein